MTVRNSFNANHQLRVGSQRYPYFSVPKAPTGDVPQIVNPVRP